jgi:hypothetical protein
VLNLPITPADDDSFSFFRVITGLGITDTTGREAMFNLELMQRYLKSSDMQQAVPDPEVTVPLDAVKKFMQAAIADNKLSTTLRKHIAERYTQITGSMIPGAPADVVDPVRAACRSQIPLVDPPYRSLRIYGLDPSFSTRLETVSINDVTLQVRWETNLAPGPIGEYLQVIDEDAAGIAHPPVDLNDPRLLAQNGCNLSESNSAFHQQSVYAVAMTTIAKFERALGRAVLWRPLPDSRKAADGCDFCQRLQVFPHKLQQANAYYSPDKIALLFGYFQAAANDPGDHLPGSTVYSCLSHDIVAHETTHAILDGMHQNFQLPTNPDVLAFHEGFADIVALMQHFTMPEILVYEIQQTRGDLQSESFLGSLAVQFGRSTGGRGALRSAIGAIDKNGVWQRSIPDPAAYQTTQEPHARGAILVAAVFDAFLEIYNRRTQDLLRIYTQGTGVLHAGAIHPDLALRLAGEATKSANHVLNMCIRALDYVPPVDITFGEYLRAIITADVDLVADDDLNYRVAFVEAFRKRGISPRDLDTLSVETLRWEGLEFDQEPPEYANILAALRDFAGESFYLTDRKEIFNRSKRHRDDLKKLLQAAFAADQAFASKLGLDPSLDFEIQELRRALRIGPDGNTIPQIIGAITQSRVIDEREQTRFMGGVTIVVDLLEAIIKYRIVKPVDSANRQAQTAAYVSAMRIDPLRALLVAPNQKEPFALLHSLTGPAGF